MSFRCRGRRWQGSCRGIRGFLLGIGVLPFCLYMYVGVCVLFCLANEVANGVFLEVNEARTKGGKVRSDERMKKWKKRRRKERKGKKAANEKGKIKGSCLFFLFSLSPSPYPSSHNQAMTSCVHSRPRAFFLFAFKYCLSHLRAPPSYLGHMAWHRHGMIMSDSHTHSSGNRKKGVVCRTSKSTYVNSSLSPNSVSSLSHRPCHPRFASSHFLPTSHSFVVDDIYY